ncbi:MAG: signal peptidase I [Cryomorphaceae bacterium]
MLSINGQTLQYNELGSSSLSLDLIENIIGVKHMVRVLIGGSRSANFGPVEIPHHQYLALGDNRDNSADSRMIGFIPRKEIVGRTAVWFCPATMMSFIYRGMNVSSKLFKAYFKTLGARLPLV